MLYLLKEFGITKSAKVSAVVFDNLRGVFKIYLVLVRCNWQTNLTNNPTRQIVAYQMSKKFLHVKQILFAVEVKSTESVFYISERQFYLPT